MIATRYTAEFKDDLNNDFVIEIFDRQASEASEMTLILGSDGFKLSTQCDDETNPYSPLFGSSVSFTCCPQADEVSEFEQFLIDLADNSQNRFNIRIKKNTYNYWVGNIMCDMMEQPDEAYPYFVQITATDGIGVLKEIEYRPTLDTFYTGSATLLEHFCNIIDKTKIFDGYATTDLILRSYFNWTGDNQTLINNSFIESTRLFFNAFHEFEDDGITVKSALNCYDVLKLILQRFSARMFMSDGTFMIIQNHGMNEYQLQMKQYKLDRTLQTGTYNITLELQASNFKRLNGGLFRYLPSTLKIEKEEAGKFDKQQNRFVYPYPNGDGTFTYMTVNTWYPLGEFFGGDYETVEISGAIKASFTQPYTTSIRVTYNLYIKVGNLYMYKDGSDYKWTTTETYIQIVDAKAVISGLYYFETEFTVPFMSEELTEGGDAFIKLVEVSWVYAGSGNPIGVPISYNWFDFLIIKQKASTAYDDATYAVPQIKSIAISKNSNTFGDYADSTMTKQLDTTKLSEEGFYNAGRCQVWTGTYWRNENNFTRNYSDQSSSGVHKLTYLLNDDLLSFIRRPVKIYEGTIVSTYYNNYMTLKIDNVRYMPMRLELNANTCQWTGSWIKQVFYPNYILNTTETIT